MTEQLKDPVSAQRMSNEHLNASVSVCLDREGLLGIGGRHHHERQRETSTIQLLEERNMEGKGSVGKRWVGGDRESGREEERGKQRKKIEIKEEQQ